MATVLNKKKSPTQTMMENLPSPQQQVTLSPAATPIQKIDLTKDQGAANYIQNAMGRAQDLQREKDTPKIVRDRATGMPKGVIMPDGKSYQGDYETIQNLISNYQNINPGKGNPVTLFPGEKLSDVKNPRDFSPAEIATPPMFTPEEIAQTGQVETAPPNDLTADIQRQNLIREAVNAKPYDEFGNINPALKKYWDTYGKSPPPPAFNKLTSFIPSGPIKNTVLNLLTKKPEVREYLSDYTQEENLDKIKIDIQAANDLITGGMAMAQTPELAKLGKEQYDEGQSLLLRADANLKLIGDNDSRKWADEVIAERRKLANYFDKIKVQDDAKMQLILNNVNTEGIQ